MTIGSHALRGVLVGALVLGALALWLSGGTPSHAASANQVQGTVVSVEGKAISWEDNGKCGEGRADGSWGLPSDTADFGTSPPGGGQRFSVAFLACVKSNATWTVEAAATDLVSTSGDAISSANVALTAAPLDGPSGDPSPAPITAACDAVAFAYCSLGGIQTVVAGAQPSPATSGFLYGYRLDVPVSASAGVYTGSVTLTASN